MHQVSKQAANQFTTFCRKLGIWGLGGLTVNKNSGSGFEFFSERILGFQELGMPRNPYEIRQAVMPSFDPMSTFRFRA